MKTIATFFALLFFAIQLSAQGSPDTLHIEQLLGELTTAYQQQEYGEARRLADVALGLCSQSKSPLLQYEAPLNHAKGLSLMRLGDYPAALPSLQKGLALRRQQFGDSHPALINSYSALGAYFNDLGSYKEAYEQFLPALKIADNSPKLHPASKASLLNNYALCQEGLGDLRGAEQTHWRVVGIRKKIAEDNPDLISSYLNLGGLKIHQGHNGEALDLTEKTLALMRQYYPDDSLAFDLGGIWQNFGVIAFESGDHATAKGYYEKALRVHIANEGLNFYKNGMQYHGLGNIELESNNLVQAEQLHLKAAAVWDSNSLPADHPYRVATLESLATIAEKRSNWEVADSLYNLVNVAIKQVYGIRHPFRVRSANRGTLLSLSQDNLDEAWTRGREALLAGGMNPDNPDLSQADISIDLVDALNNIGRVATLQFRQTKETIWAERADTYFVAAGSLWEKLTLGTYNEDSEKYFVSQARPAVENILEFLLKDRIGSPGTAAKAFDWSDRAHAALLHKSLRRSGALQFGGVPDSLQAQTASLQAQLNFLEKQKLEARALPPAGLEAALQDLEGQRFELNSTLIALMTFLEEKYPGFRSRRDLAAPGLLETQKRLLTGQCLLEYFVGDSSLFIFVVRKDTLVTYMQPLNFPLAAWVKNLRYGLTDFHLQKIKSDNLYPKTTKAYADAAHDLYLKLIAPVEKWLTLAVMVAPDGVLNSVPFEVLLTTRPERSERFNTHAYLLKKHRFSYIYSAGLLNSMTETEERAKPKRALLAVAPYAPLVGQEKKYGALPILPASKTEALHAQHVWDGDALIGPVFSKDSVLKMMPEYKIVHWTSHAIANNKLGELSYIAMPDSNHLYVRDFYNLRLGADLMILSACETNAGSPVAGEGVISLARACAYAGVRSIVTSQWPVNDLTTQRLMAAFHDKLFAKESKDEALRQAKLEIINSAQTSLEAHPFFWAGFIAIGDMRAID